MPHYAPSQSGGSIVFRVDYSDSNFQILFVYCACMPMPYGSCTYELMNYNIQAARDRKSVTHKQFIEGY